MTKARLLANYISDGSPLADGAVDVSEVSGAAPLANPTFTGTASGTFSGPLTGDVAGELDLSPIASTIADTAVDVFVYDTSKDSDGGAWRKRTQGTSWYNETLNTATRGSRKEFPAVAVIVAESNQVTIYDGDDPSLPMWMVFTAGTNHSGLVAYGDNGYVSCVYMLNSILLMGTYSGSGNGSVTGLSVANFVADSQSKYDETGYIKSPLGLYDRNDTTHGLWWHSILPRTVSQAIVSQYINDVAMTVLPNAPIDAATGLPVPTIAVATDGGVSVIKDDGTVVDITRASSAEISSVDFYTGYLIISSSNVGAVWYYDYIPSSDETISPSNGHIEYYDSGFANKDTPAYLGYVNTKSAGSYIGTTGNNNSGLTAVDFNNTDYTKSSTAWITPTYNTGWMNGDIKLATLSDTDDTDVTGSELVTNGTFDSNTSGWTAGNSALLTHSTDKLVVTNNGVAYGHAYQQITGLTAGKSYTISWESPSSDANAKISVGGIGAGGLVNATGVTAKTFVATGSSTYVNLWSYTTNTSAAVDFDNISVRLAEEDRSVNGKGLQVFGTVTKNPVATGADLVAYSGFSTSNYLEQPYNSDLDFNGVDWCVMCWVNYISSGTRILFSKSPPTSITPPYFELQTNGSNMIWVGNGVNTRYDLGDCATGWTHIAAVRLGETFYGYRNGVLAITGPCDTNWSHSNNDTLRIGYRQDDYAGAWHGSLALFRISATAPSPEQIAKIYEDEKVLFQENAQATLYGSSDAVTALAYDDSTELLHVGTSAGRSDFQGLRRVNNTTNAVGAAISASNGLIAED